MSQKRKQIRKVLVAGPVGVGKTTAVQSASDVPVLVTEARPTDDTALHKPTTTVAMDFGILTLDDNDVVHLYGTPGQKRFDFMWEILSGGSSGVIVLVDGSREGAVEALGEYLDAFKTLVAQGRVVVGVTRLNPRQPQGLERYRERLARMPLSLPVFEADPRARHDVVVLIRALLAASRWAAA